MFPGSHPWSLESPPKAHKFLSQTLLSGKPKCLSLGCYNKNATDKVTLSVETNIYSHSPGESPPPGTQMMSSLCVLTRWKGWAPQGLFHKDMNPIHGGSTLLTNHLPQAPPPNTITGGISCPHESSGGTQILVCGARWDIDLAANHIKIRSY